MESGNVDIYINTQIVFLINNNDVEKVLKVLSLKCIVKDLISKQIQSQIKNIMASNQFVKECAFKTYSYVPSINKAVGFLENRMFLVNLDDILYFYADKEKINIVAEGNLNYRSKYTLKYWEGRLFRNNFFRCHRSFLVNMKKVKEICPAFNSTFVLKFNNHKELVPVGRNYIKDFKTLVGL